MQTSNFTLRLPHSTLNALRLAAAADGVAINQYINVAVSEKLASRATAKAFLEARARGGSAQRALEVLALAGVDGLPQ